MLFFFQITYRDVFEEDRTFGPVFNDTHFLRPLLKLQKDIEAIVADDGTTLQVGRVAKEILYAAGLCRRQAGCKSFFCPFSRIPDAIRIT